MHSYLTTVGFSFLPLLLPMYCTSTFGDTKEAYHAFMERAAMCGPPLDDAELMTIWRSALGFFQRISKEDSYVSPEPWDMPGYDSQVIMAAGAFVQGSSIELSADGPLKPPYAVYFQGGLTWEHAKLGVMMSLQKLVDAKLVSLN